MALKNASSITKVAASTDNIMLVAENLDRFALSFYNNSTDSLYVKFGLGASLDSFTIRIPSYGYFEIPFNNCYTGRIDGFWSGVDGSVMITEGLLFG